MKKLLFLFIISILTIVGCSNDEKESLIDENKNGSAIVFGKKISKNELEAGNSFKIGEPVHFYVKSKSEFGQKEITIELLKLKNKEWSKLTESKLTVNKNSTETMNGLPASVFEKVGEGAYMLKAKVNGDIIAKGEFVYNK